MYTIQIEVSTHCNAACLYCPLSIYRSGWDKRHIDTVLYSKILREGLEAGVGHIHLQGWGEPLMHPEFPSMLREAGRWYKTSFTTNGVLLTKLMNKILEAGVDVVAVTFAGARPETHDKIRVGSPHSVVVQNYRAFLKRAGERKPHAVAIYMMLRDTIKELPEFIDLAAEIGVDEVRLSNLTYIPSSDFWDWKVFSQFFQPEPPHAIAVVEKAREKAVQHGIKLTHRGFTPVEHIECPESPTTTFYINVRGDVMPCPYLALPHTVRCFEKRCVKTPTVTYGNLYDQNLTEILKNKKYKEFTNKFKQRRYSPEAPPPDECINCYRLYWI